MKKVSIVIPTYNEIVNIKIIIDKIFYFLPEVNIIVVDDNSPDLTWQYVEGLAQKKSNVFLVKNEKKMGIGNAYKAGFAKALAINSDVIGQMDADLSHDPKYLSKMIAWANDYDVVIGSRYKTGINVINWPITRVLLSFFANKYASLVTGVKINDLTGGFKVFKRGVLEQIDFTKIMSDGYSFQIETNYIVHKLGFKVYEHPIVFTDRVNGSSKLDRNIIYEALFNVIKLRFKNTKSYLKKK